MSGRSVAAPGSAFCVAAALLYGISLPLSRSLFDGATNPLSLGVARYLLLSLGLAVWVQWIRRYDSRLGVRDTLVALGVGALFALVSVGQLLAVVRIPVSLTTLLFYTYPAMTITVVALRSRCVPKPRELAVVVMASLGLVLALDADFRQMDPAGIAFALMAAASVSASFLIIEGALAHADALRASAGSALGATVVSAIALVLFSGLRMPGTGAELALMGLVMCTFAAAVVSMFIGVARAGSVRASLVLFLEPVTAIGVAIVVLDETLTPRQGLGAVAVVLAVLLRTPLPGSKRVAGERRHGD